MSVNIPETAKKRIVIIGAGFAGLKLAKKLVGSGYQIVLIDKNNYHQFQPLFYQAEFKHKNYRTPFFYSTQKPNRLFF